MMTVSRRKANEAQPTVPSTRISFHHGLMGITVEGATVNTSSLGGGGGGGGGGRGGYGLHWHASWQLSPTLSVTDRAHDFWSSP